MFGRFAAAALSALALAGALLVPSIAEAKPSFLACSAPDYVPLDPEDETDYTWFPIYIPEEAESFRVAVAQCRIFYGGHPVGAF